MTLGWTLVEASRSAEGETRAQLKALCLTCLIAMALPALLLLFFGGWSLLGLAGIALLAPMAGYGATILHAKKMPPMYARAIARMKFGKYPEAELEIIRELEKCEDDFDGWMMLAELYARHFKELSEADRIIRDLCDQPNVIAVQVSIALNRLADWHLELSDDPVSARGALEEIGRRLPDSHLAKMARQRIGHLPAAFSVERRRLRVVVA